VAQAGVLVPEVVAAGRCGPRDDAVLVTRLPAGSRLAELPGDQVTDELVEEFLRSVLTLRAAGIAHGALSRRRSSWPAAVRACATSGVPHRRLRRREPTGIWPPRSPSPPWWPGWTGRSPQ
jgi:hypothetical protein